MKKMLDPVHPGEVLREEFLKPLAISQYRLAQEIDVPARRINEIVHEDRSITADTAVRLASFFGTSEMFWMNLQSRFELDRLAERKSISALARARSKGRVAGAQSTASRKVASAVSPAARAGHSSISPKVK